MSSTQRWCLRWRWLKGVNIEVLLPNFSMKTTPVKLVIARIFEAPHGLRIMCENYTKVAIQSSQFGALALFRRMQTANLHPVCEPKTGARNHCVNTLPMLAGDGSHFSDENWNHRGTKSIANALSRLISF